MTDFKRLASVLSNPRPETMDEKEYYTAMERRLNERAKPHIKDKNIPLPRDLLGYTLEDVHSATGNDLGFNPVDYTKDANVFLEIPKQKITTNPNELLKEGVPENLVPAFAGYNFPKQNKIYLQKESPWPYQTGIHELIHTKDDMEYPSVHLHPEQYPESLDISTVRKNHDLLDMLRSAMTAEPLNEIDLAKLSKYISGDHFASDENREMTYSYPFKRIKGKLQK